MSPAAAAQIQDALVSVSVRYRDFSGREQVGNILLHNLVADTVHDFFVQALALRFPIHSVIPIQDERFNGDDALSCAANNSSGYNDRLITGSSLISKHAIGCAFDINPQQNPYIRYEHNEPIYTIPEPAEYNPSTPGTLNSEHPLVSYMKERGWTWGGDWTAESGRIDYQHFEIVPPELASFLR
jgi:poly-gamma-glutamate synthesis protein (capsule biosynthesis protein)